MKEYFHIGERIFWRPDYFYAEEYNQTMDEFYQRIEDLKQALAGQKLVIFVGAGVSRNSNLPDRLSLHRKAGNGGIHTDSAILLLHG